MTQIAAVQTCSGDDVGRNLTALAGAVEEASAAGAALVLLPECCALMARDIAQLRAAAEAPGEGPIQAYLSALARRLGVWIIAGTLPLRSADRLRVYNTTLVYDAAGECAARYDKIHLFDMRSAGESYRESGYTAAGDACVVAATPVGAVGLSVCYDLRFAEMYQRLAEMGAQCLVVPSAFTAATGAAHWEVLLRARAIENACYVIAAAQVGEHPSGRRTYGNSLIIDPWGEVLARRENAPGVLLADVDLDRCREVRERMPCHAHRRPDVF